MQVNMYGVMGCAVHHMRGLGAKAEDIIAVLQKVISGLAKFGNIDSLDPRRGASGATVLPKFNGSCSSAAWLPYRSIG
jgi:hypothetical protein